MVKRKEITEKIRENFKIYTKKISIHSEFCSKCKENYKPS